MADNKIKREEIIMGFYSGKTVLKYKRKNGSFENSTGSCRVFAECAYSYREKLAISKEFKIGRKRHKIIFYNTHYWSRESNSHFSGIQGHNFMNTGIEISLNFNGSMNFMQSVEDLSIDIFKNCALNDNLVNFIHKYFSERSANKFINSLKKRDEINNKNEISQASADRLVKKIRELNYATSENLDRAITKYKNLTGPVSRISYVDHSELDNKDSKFLDVLEKHIATFDNTLLQEILEHRKLQVFTELGERMAV